MQNGSRLRDLARLPKDLVLYLARHECGTKICREKGIESAGGAYRLLRGGSWYTAAVFCESGFRARYSPIHEQAYFLGFRVARNSGKRGGK